MALDVTPSRPRVLALATKGAGSNEEDRLRALLSAFDPQFFAFERSSKRKQFTRLLKQLLREKPQLAVMEGTGLAGGVAMILARLIGGVPYVVSSGDAVGPFIGSKLPVLGPVFGLYERILYRFAAGFIGWTPYLVGRALTFGCPRAITCAGFAPLPLAAWRGNQQIRTDLGVPQDAVVFGIVGSLAWNRRKKYCYGLELVQAVRRTTRADLCVVVIGDGNGLSHLHDAAGDDARVILPGPVPADRVVETMRAFDVASLPQSCDGVGSFRYTTKISEYLAAGLPMVTGQIPLAYDFDTGWIWRLPGDAPWEDRYVAALAALMNNLTPADLAAKRGAVPASLAEFDRDAQVARATAFVRDILHAKGRP